MSTETSYRVTCDSGSPKCHGRETFSSRKGLVRYIERSRWLTEEDGGHICPGCQEWHEERREHRRNEWHERHGGQ